MLPFFKKRPETLIDDYGDRPSRLLLFWQRQKIILRRASILLVVLILLGGAGWLSWMSLAKNASKNGWWDRIPAFAPLQIHHITIIGRHLTEENEILEKLGTGLNHSILNVDVETARRQIDTLPFIDHSTVERHLPDSIVVTVVEKHPIAIWQVDRHFVLINQDGAKVSEQELTAQNNAIFRKLPLVVGPGANIEAGNILTILNKYPNINSHMLALIRIGQRRWNILMQNGTTLLLPEGAEDAALARLHDYQDQMHLLDRPLKTIDMRLPDRMVIQAATPSDENTPSHDSASSGASSP